jgi:hypothetical protein
MADFSTTNARLNAARSGFDQAQLAAVRASEQARRAKEAFDRARRSAVADDGALARLKADLEHALASKDAAWRSLAASRASVAAAAEQFGVFNDPRVAANTLNDRSPILLLPVRIETRFRNAEGRNQLLVRIYPDDCSVDTFEPDLSTAELTNVKNYWKNWWRAGGIENDQRGAWASLVRAHGSGRASWLADNFQPSNLPSMPVKARPTDIILTIAAEAPLPDEAAVAQYWRSYWLADGDNAKQQAALSALKAAVGDARAAEILKSFAPFNLMDAPAPPLKRSDVTVSVAVVIFPPDPPTNLRSWSQAPQVRQFPDRFVVLGFQNGAQTIAAIGNPVTLPLYTGPDPSVSESEGIHPDPATGDLFIPPELKWMVDFETAAAAGMALTIELTPAQAAAGFDRLFVIGLQLATPEADGPAALQQLLAHHQASRSGFEFLRQGARAHNSTGAPSAYTKDDDADTSFNDRKGRPLFTWSTDANAKADGQWFAEFLRLDPSFVATVHGSGGNDQKQARALQRALWPATLGYWMNTLFTPASGKASLFSDIVIDETHWFVSQFVSGRGALPAIRIGGQPYGILPTTAFSRIRWYEAPVIAESPSLRFLKGLYGILRRLDADWDRMRHNVSAIGTTSGDPHQILLDVVAQHPSSVEWYSRTAESLAQLYNTFNFWGFGRNWYQIFLQLNLQAQAASLLAELGYRGADLPDILNHFFLISNPQIQTIIDDVPLSEAKPIRAYTDDNRNYIQWLIDAASQSLDTLRMESGFTEDKSPEALLYLYLRHALMLGYYDATYRFHRDLNILDANALLSMRLESPFIHVADAQGTSESRFAALYKTETRITGSPSTLVSDYIRSKIGLVDQTSQLSDQLDALKVLKDASTAQLERLFAEHIDICSYRYDAWLLGLVNHHIAAQRSSQQGEEGSPAGLYLGGYAWVENLRPTPLAAPAQVPEGIAQNFPAPLVTDPAGGGYIHAPSMQHADTAAILRSGYIANRDSSQPEALAVNLSSDRVRMALSLIEGIRNGQSLGALLGYQFERGLHDAHSLAEVDAFIYPMRKAFPLVADSLTSTKTDPTVSIEAIEARNVMDGKKLLDQVRKSGTKSYPYGLTTLKAVTLPAQQQALDAETQRLLDAYDAIADIALAEGVHQAAQGNYDRVASTMEAYTTGNFPPEPAVVETPPSGITLTHRFALHLKPGLLADAAATPRAQAEPAVDAWLETMLPPLNKIACIVSWTDPVTKASQNHVVTLADLNIHPLDLIFLLKPDSAQAMAELDDRITLLTEDKWKPRPDTELTIEYLNAGPGRFSIFETGALVRHLRTLVTQSRPLRATDVLRSNDAKLDDNAGAVMNKTRVTGPLGNLQTLLSDINSFVAAMPPDLDDQVEDAAKLLERAARFSIPQSGWGFLYASRGSIFADLLAQVSGLVSRWTKKLADFDAAILAYNTTPPPNDDEKFAALEAAETLIATTLVPRPANPALLLAALGTQRTAFENRLKQFSDILKTTDPSFTNLLASAGGLGTAEFDTQPFDLSAFTRRRAIISDDIARALNLVAGLIKTRVDAVTSLVDSDLPKAAKALFGEDFPFVPEFSITDTQKGEWTNAYNASLSGAPFDYLKNTLKIDFPVDEWMYQVARVRQVFRTWESAVMLSTAFEETVLQPVPVQFPFDSGASWLAMQYPPDEQIDSDRLLYTALYSEPFDAAKNQCGLLLDDWTEVIPSTTRDTALTFQFTRPDNEPPQSMLLVTSPGISGRWQWDDLVAALHETLDLAQKRAVEPAALDPTVYSRFLPATVMASTRSLITIATNITAAAGAMRAAEGGLNA